MLPFDKIKEYSDSVCRQIRWEKAHFEISEEIINHITDQRDAYMKDGLNEADATDKAIAQMGDPIEVGTQLDRIHRPRPQWGMLVLTFLMAMTGIIIQIMLSTNSGFPPFRAVQGVFLLAGAVIMAITYYSGFSLIGRYPKAIYYCVVVVAIIALIASIRINGKAYYAAYIPVIFPVAFSGIVYRLKGKGYAGIVLCELAFIPPAAVTLFIPSFTGLLLFAVSSLVLLSVAVAKNWYKIKKRNGYLLIYVPTFAALVLLLSNPSVQKHIYGALHPETIRNGSGYIACVIKSMLENSKLFGCGTLPEQFASLNGFPLPANTDFLLTFVIFKMGWLVFGAIMVLLFVFITKGFILCFRQKSILGLLVSISILLTFIFEITNYVFYDLGFTIFEPLSLPLFSQGSIAILINLALIGLMLSVFRNETNPVNGADNSFVM